MKKLLLLLLFKFIFFIGFTQYNFTEKSYAGDPLYDFITYWWKVPYKYGGNTKKGIDCSAFTLTLILNVYNTKIPRTASQQYKFSQRIKKKDLKDGDLVFFRTKVKSGWHVGVYLSDGWFVHSKSKTGVTISNLNEPYYKKTYYGSGRVNIN